VTEKFDVVGNFPGTSPFRTDRDLDKTLKPPDNSLLELPKQYCDLWESMRPGASTRYLPSIEEALEYADRAGSQRGGLQVLVTGSLHLVGGALYLLQRSKADES
jgi:folylpolyglutamate synthase